MFCRLLHSRERCTRDSRRLVVEETPHFFIKSLEDTQWPLTKVNSTHAGRQNGKPGRLPCCREKGGIDCTRALLTLTWRHQRLTYRRRLGQSGKIVLSLTLHAEVTCLLQGTFFQGGLRDKNFFKVFSPCLLFFRFLFATTFPSVHVDFYFPCTLSTSASRAVHAPGLSGKRRPYVFFSLSTLLF